MQLICFSWGNDYFLHAGKYHTFSSISSTPWLRPLESQSLPNTDGMRFRNVRDRPVTALKAGYPDVACIKQSFFAAVRILNYFWLKCRPINWHPFGLFCRQWICPNDFLFNAVSSVNVKWTTVTNCFDCRNARLRTSISLRSWRTVLSRLRIASIVLHWPQCMSVMSTAAPSKRPSYDCRNLYRSFKSAFYIRLANLLINENAKSDFKKMKSYQKHSFTGDVMHDQYKTANIKWDISKTLLNGL